MMSVDYKNEKIDVTDLKLGMFVINTNKSWLDLPFPMQGFIIENDHQIKKLQALCIWVIIDRSRSLGLEYTSSEIETDTNSSFLKVLQNIKSVDEKPITLKTNKSFISYILHAFYNIFGLFNNKTLPSTNADSESGEATFNGYKISIYQGSNTVEEEITQAMPVYEQAQIATREIYEAISNSQNLDISHLTETIDEITDRILCSPDAMIWLSKLKKSDSYTYNHSLNVSINLMAFASFLSMEKEEIKELGMTGLLQDVGKAKVPSEILNKVDPLTAKEINLIRKHVNEGIGILKINQNIPSSVILLASQHHERIDGSGYPLGLKGVQLSLKAQMTGLIDTYCALTTTRPYAKGLYHQQALEEIRKRSGKAFSKQLVDQLVQFLGMYPISTLVELNTGEVGVVIQQNTVRRLLPRVMILLDANKKKNNFPTVINLLYAPKTPDGEPYEIIRSLAPDSYGLNLESLPTSSVIAT